MRCEQCELTTINGIVCHEIGCPLAWKNESRECKWCGSEFVPESEHQICCDDSCFAAYLGEPEYVPD